MLTLQSIDGLQEPPESERMPALTAANRRVVIHDLEEQLVAIDQREQILTLSA